MTTFLAIVLGASVGGVLYARWQHTPGLLNVILVLIAGLGTWCSFGIPRVQPSGSHKAFQWNPFEEIVKGLKALCQEKSLWLTVVGISYFWFLGAFLQLALLLLGKEVMGVNDYQTAILGTFLAVGIGLGSLLAGKLSGDKVELGLVPIGSIGMGLAAILLSVASHYSYSWTLAMLSLVGVSGGLFVVPLQALLQHKSAKGEKGRILATNNVVNTAGMIAAFGTIWLFGHRWHLQADQSILIVGCLTLLVTGYILSIRPDFLMRFSLWLLTRAVYCIKIVGPGNAPGQGPALLVCNHVSQVDALLVGACVQRFIRFMMWKPYYEIKGLHWFFQRMRAIPTAGGNRQEVVQSLEKAREALQAGHVVCIFAEGAISRTGNMLPFKRGFEKIMALYWRLVMNDPTTAPGLSSDQARSSRETTPLSLVLRFRNNARVFGTVAHIKTTCPPAPNWRGNCGAQHLGTASTWTIVSC